MILHSFEYPPVDGGISRLCAEIAAGYRRRGVALRVLTQGDGAASDRSEIRLASARPRREWDAFRALRRHLGEHAGPVVCGVWYPEGLLALLAGGWPYVVLAHGSELMPPREGWRRGVWKRLQERVLTGARLVVANSEYTRRLVVASAPRSRAVAIPLAVDHRRFTPGDRAAAQEAFGVAERFVIGSVSRIHAYKGHDVVLRALAALPTTARERLVYLIAGQGPDTGRLRALAEELGVADSVRRLGFLDESRLPDFYRACDLFVLCTRESHAAREVEGFGLVFLEAQACGTPVVGTRSGGIPDAIAEGEGGWLIAQDDAPALARRVAELLDDPNAVRAAGAAARARVERAGTWEHYLGKFAAALAAEGLTVA